MWCAGEPDARGKHGDDLNAMARDRKLNAMQHTVSVLRDLVVSYVAYPELVEGGGSLDFRQECGIFAHTHTHTHTRRTHTRRAFSIST